MPDGAKSDDPHYPEYLHGRELVRKRRRRGSVAVRFLAGGLVVPADNLTSQKMGAPSFRVLCGRVGDDKATERPARGYRNDALPRLANP
jgi:hypothetical protein